MSEIQIGQSLVAGQFVPLDAVPQDRIRGRVRCPRGHRMALLTRGPDMLYTGKDPIPLSDSVEKVVLVSCHAAGCPDGGAWEIDLARLRSSLQWRRGVLVLPVTVLGNRVPQED